MNWDEWISINKKKIEHVAGFEEMFVRNILANIPEIEPSDVVAQFHFNDSNGGNRYIDFMILNYSKGYQLPIELDGYWKVTDYNHFNDMLERQNDLVSIYGILLRYTNKKMKRQPDQIIREIRDKLELQSKDQISQKMIQKENQRRANEYQYELDQMRDELEQQKSSQASTIPIITSREIASLQASIAELQENIKRNDIPSPAPSTLPVPKTITTTTPKSSIKTKIISNQVLVAASVGLVIVTIGANTFFSRNDTNDSISLVGQQNNQANTPLSVVPDYLDNDLDTDNLKHNDVRRSTPNPNPQFSQEEKIVVNNISPELIKEPAPHSYEAAISTTVPASSSYKHIGDYRVVCGHVAQVKEFSKGQYLNLGASYPNQDMTIVVWNSDIANFDNVFQYEGRELCIKGSISSYNGTPQIVLSSTSQIQ